MLFGPDGQVWLCDWNFVGAGVSWLDSLTLLVGIYGDGLDAESYVQTLPVFGDVPADDVDTVLVVLAGMFLAATIKPETPGSPYSKTHRTWYAQATTAWLADRRGWHN